MKKKRLSFLQQLAYTFFSKMDAKKRKSDELAQPAGEKGGKPLSNDAITDKKKKLIKKLIIWASVLLILGGIIAIIVVFSTRKTEEFYSKPTVALNQDKTALLITQQNQPQSTVVMSPNNLLASYYGGTGSQIKLVLQPQAGLPVSFMVSQKLVDKSLVYTFGNATLTATPIYNQQGDVTKFNFDLLLSNVSVNLPSSESTSMGSNPNGNNTKTDSNLETLINTLGNTLTQAFVSAQIQPSGFNWWGLFSILMPILTLLLLLWFYSSMMKKQLGGGQDSIFGMGKSNVKPTKTNVKFSDVAGIDEVKTELKEIVDYIKHPQRYAAMGARAPKGVILYGPPGTGKTLIAKAVAGEANCSFFATSGSAFEDMLVGVGAKRVRELFAKARKDAPAIIFIDEIDSVASKRGKNDIVGGGGGVADQTINQLLAEMDGFSTDSGVVVIAATNRLDVLDDAILRPGRFDRQIQVTLPDIKGREAILKIHAKNKNLSSKVNLLDVARRTPGFSGAQLENVLNEATLLAVREKKNVVSMADIDEAIDRTVGGPARKGRVITEAERRQIAYHEAGHALVGLHTENTEVVQKITIIPRGDAAGYTLQTPAEQEKVIQSKSDILSQMRMTLGGRAAEEIVFGKNNITSGAANDLYKVTNMARAMTLQLGMTNMGLTQYVPSEGTTSPYQQKMYSEATARELDQTIEDIIQKEYVKAKEVIIQNRRELDLIVQTLLVLETIVKEQIDYIHNNLKLPPEVLESNKSLLNDATEDTQKADKDETEHHDDSKDQQDHDNHDEPNDSGDDHKPKGPDTSWLDK